MIDPDNIPETWTAVHEVRPLRVALKETRWGSTRARIGLVDLAKRRGVEVGFRVGPLGAVHPALEPLFEAADPRAFDPRAVQVVVRRRTLKARACEWALLAARRVAAAVDRLARGGAD